MTATIHAFPLPKTPIPAEDLKEILEAVRQDLPKTQEALEGIVLNTSLSLVIFKKALEVVNSLDESKPLPEELLELVLAVNEIQSVIEPLAEQMLQVREASKSVDEGIEAKIRCK